MEGMGRQERGALGPVAVGGRPGKAGDAAEIITASPRSPSIDVHRIESLEEICGWLGTYRERLLVARDHDRLEVTTVVNQLDARYRQRRAELA